MNPLQLFLDSITNTDKYNLESIKRKFFCETILSGKKCIVFGASEGGRKFINLLRQMDINVVAVLDNDERKRGTTIEDVSVYLPGDFCHDTGLPVLIASRYVAPIDKQLLAMGFKIRIPHYVMSIVYPQYFPNSFHKYMREIIIENRPRIEKVYDLLNDGQSRELFLQILRFRIILEPSALPVKDSLGLRPLYSTSCSQDVFIDVGAYDGDTLLEFLQHSQGNFHRYLAFEPDQRNYEQLLRNIPAVFQDRIVAYKLGVGAKHDIVSFSNEGNMNSMIAAEGREKIEIVPLDGYVGDEQPSMIKIDVEGYEREVLRGAAQIITANKPKLFVSVYHYPEDLWELLLQIHGYNPAYKFSLHHLGEEIYETMLVCS